jgi:hypothetical protein
VGARRGIHRLEDVYKEWVAEVRDDQSDRLALATRQRPGVYRPAPYWENRSSLIS